MLIVLKTFMFAVLAAVGYVALFQIRQRLFHRLLLLTIGVVVGAMIAVPELATAAANMMGVGRGVDLVFYLSHVLGAYLLVRLFQRHVRQEEQITSLIRSLSLSEARNPEVADATAPELRIFGQDPPPDSTRQPETLPRSA